MNLNKKQRMVLLVGLLIFVASIAFPPYEAWFKGSTAERSFDIRTFAGYGSWLKPPPLPQSLDWSSANISIAHDRLLLQLMAIIVVTATIMAVVKDNKRRE